MGMAEFIASNSAAVWTVVTVGLIPLFKWLLSREVGRLDARIKALFISREQCENRLNSLEKDGAILGERNSNVIERLTRVEKRIEEQGRAEEEAFRQITSTLGSISERLALIEGAISSCPTGPGEPPRRRRKA